MRLILIICFICSLSTPVQAFNQDDFLRSLEKMGEWETAYPLALQLAQQRNTYEAWRDVALKYQQFDKEGVAYLKAWQQAHQRNDIESYKNFLSIRPQAELNLHAIHTIYQLTEKLGTTTAYRDFVEQFPGSIQAIDALMKLQNLFYEEVKKENTIDAYEAFAVFFPRAPQTPAAIQAAYDLEKQALEQEVRSLDCKKEGEEKRICETEAKERIARRLFNDARVAEKDADKSIEGEKAEIEARKMRLSLQSARKYSILGNTDLFKETKVFTEMLDREERKAFENQLFKKQDEVKQAIDDMKVAVVAAIKEQTQILGGKLDTLDNSLKSIEHAIATHQQHMEAQLAKINQAVEQGNATLEKLQLSRTGIINGSIWSLASALLSNRDQIEDQLTEHRNEIKQMFEELKQNHKPANFEKIGFKKVFLPAIFGITGGVRFVCRIVRIGGDTICTIQPPICPAIRIAGLVCSVLPF